MEEKHQTKPEIIRGGIGNKPPTRIGAGEMPPARYMCVGCKRLVLESKQILPHMNAYICPACEKEGNYKSTVESEISNRVPPPWSEGQVQSLNDYQISQAFLPFVCPVEHILVANKDGLTCPNCANFSVTWAYGWMLDAQWKTIATSKTE